MEWVKRSETRYEREDGAVVKYDIAASTLHSRPWLSGHRGWMIYLPNEEYPVFYKTKRGLHVPIKFKTINSAIGALDRKCQAIHR